MSQGQVPEPATFSTGAQMLGSIHECRKIVEHDNLFHSHKYICDCKCFITNAIYCSHVLASFHLDEDIAYDIYEKTQDIAGDKPKHGRPRQVKDHCLQIEESNQLQTIGIASL